jgi:hypothetical protein
MEVQQRMNENFQKSRYVIVLGLSLPGFEGFTTLSKICEVKRKR